MLALHCTPLNAAACQLTPMPDGTTSVCVTCAFNCAPAVYLSPLPSMQALYGKLVAVSVSLFERNVMPDVVSRRAIRQLLSYRLREILAGDASAIADREQA